MEVPKNIFKKVLITIIIPGPNGQFFFNRPRRKITYNFKRIKIYLPFSYIPVLFLHRKKVKTEALTKIKSILKTLPHNNQC